MARYEYGTSAKDYNRYQYISGNTVKKTDPYLEYQREKRRKELEKEELKRQRQREKQRELEVRQNRLYVLFLMFTTVLCVSMCVGYLYWHSVVQNNSNAVTKLQNDLYALRDENESKRTNLAIKENLVEIREIAINQLGMTTPVEGQIIYYTSPSDKEIVQYQEIPENGFLPKGILSKRGS